MKKVTATQESMESTKKHWKTPMLHTRGIEETLGGSTPSGLIEDSEYNPSSAIS